MPFWMTHPQHGEMPVYDRGEVERNEKFGWKLLNEGPAPERNKPAAVLDEVEAESLPAEAPPTATEAKRKPGRPPKAK